VLRFEAIGAIWIGRVGASHMDDFLDVRSFVEGAAQPRFPQWVIFKVDALAITSCLLRPLLHLQ